MTSRPARLAAVATLASSTAALLLVSSGTGAASNVKANGTALCQIKGGSGTLNPGLTPAGSSGGVKITFQGSFVDQKCQSKLKKPKKDQVLGGTFSASGFYNAPAAGGPGSSCADFDGPDVVGQIVVTINWAMSGAPIAPTTITYSGNTGTVSGSPTDTIDLTGSTSTKAGSFSSTAAPAVTKMLTTIPGPSCGAGPYTTFTVTGGYIQV